jgi:hypothetical protein
VSGPTAFGRTLSKSDFKLARTCDAKLYFRENHYPDQNQVDLYLSLLRDGAFMVEALAQAKRPDGILCDYGPDVIGDSARTLELLQRETVRLFQPTLMWGRRLVRFDILEKSGSTIRLIEVKSKSIDGAEHKASRERGELGLMRGKRRPFAVVTDWRKHIEDVAFQTLVLSRMLPDVTVQPFLLLVDKSKRTTIDNVPRLFSLARDQNGQGANRHSYTRFIGTADQLAALDLLTEIDVTDEVASLREEVDAESGRFEAMLDSEWDPSFSAHSADCKDCEFKLNEGDESSGFAHCWGSLAYTKPHVLELGRVGTAKYTDGTPLVEAMFETGTSSLFDVPEECLCKKDGTVGPQAEQQLRQIRQTRSGDCWIGPNLRGNVERLTYPLHFIDFEASRLALPYHAKMRPYGLVTFQWSCHTVDAPGATPRHAEWLNTTDLWPNTSFASALRQTIGDSATVLTWSGYEGSTLREIDRELDHFNSTEPGLSAWIDNVVANRIVDLHDWAEDDFYHPGMRGRTSIKVVTDALWRADPAMRDQFTSWTGQAVSESEDPYNALPALTINGFPQDVREGTGAVRAYEAMMYGVEKDDQVAKDAWCKLLKQYCKLDTMSMVLIFEHWRRITS